ncbi:peptidyl-tRNA hydrolase II domain-containing protein [Gaertneriomyces semiglobifer]|nr:peptidyl-tRNA hydrolase II domain-containing protein [Gaertneriomyces semiglobifer]
MRLLFRSHKPCPLLIIKHFRTANVRKMNTDSGGAQAEAAETEPLTMFLVLRKDLQKNLGWSTGSVVTQGAHAATAILHLQQDDPDVIDYFKDLPRMHKVTYETKNEASLTKVCNVFDENGVVYHRWIEQPENIPTCLATKPYRRSQIEAALRKCKLSLYR